jgi:hypothetical protein
MLSAPPAPARPASHGTLGRLPTERLDPPAWRRWPSGDRPGGDGSGRRLRPGARAQPLVIVVSPWAAFVQTTAAPAPESPARAAASAPPTKVIEPDAGERAPTGDAAAALRVEQLGDTLLRVRWAGDARDAREVGLVIADAERRVLATQTTVLTPAGGAAPFTALFERSARVAFAGVVVVRADGGSTTTLLPLAPAGAARP